MGISIIRFFAKGWINDLYVAPEFHATYYGFEWVKMPGEFGMYFLFALMFLGAMGVMLGWYYRISAILFFLTFSYVELIDKATYLNHYYLVTLLAFLLIFVPANRNFSLDVVRDPNLNVDCVPAWCVNIFKLQLAIVYIYAGIAKLNYEWLIDAMPLRIWLPANSHLPIIGKFFNERWLAYVFSWFGAIYDLFIVFFLLKSSTRVWAYVVVIIFHLLTWYFFPIGMFPVVMILLTLIFFSPEAHERLIKIFRWKKSDTQTKTTQVKSRTANPTVPALMIAIFFAIQLLLPWRFLLYPGKLYWTEQGFRFSWRVMMMEKGGYVIYHVTDASTGRKVDVMPGDYLTDFQAKMLSTQPDMILEFAHFVEKKMIDKGMKQPQVRVEAYATLNGSGSRPLIDPSVDLAKVEDGFGNKSWILPFER